MNANPANHHLTDQDLDDHLLGLAQPATEAHLAACQACAARQAQCTLAINHFNQASLAWSEAKSNTLTRDLTAVQSTIPPRLGAAAACLCGVTALALLLTVSLPHPQPDPPSLDQPTQSDAPSSDREREIAGDNAILQQIDAALYRPEPSPEQTYRLTPQSDASDTSTPPPHTSPAEARP